MKRLGVLGGIFVLLMCPRFAAATDPWDLPSGHVDDNNGTDNELASGSEQIHDLQAVGAIADQDWYLIGQLPYSSYEVIVDGLTEPVASIPATQTTDPIAVDLVDGAGALINSGYAFSSIGAARTLRIRNTTGSEITNQYIRVMGAADGCGTTCAANAQYRILQRETTLLMPRFNNSGSQTTVLVLQNGQNTSVSVTARFWSATGTLLGSSAATTINAHGTMVLATQTVAGVAGQSGSVTIDHNGRYGQLSGKGVALEPSTGFTFDTAVTPKLN